MELLGKKATLTHCKPWTAVSLGSDCQTAWQLGVNQVRGPSYPFDWISVTFDSLFRLLKNDFADWLGRDDLSLLKGKYVLDNRYGFKFVHDFQIKDDSKFLSDYQSHFEKFQRRIERFRQLVISQEKVLFVRRELTKDKAVRLRDLIATLWPRLCFSILVLDDSQEIIAPWDLPQITNYFMIQQKPYNWKGDNTLWADVLKVFPLGKVIVP